MADRGQSDHIWDTSAQIDSTGSANAYVIATAESITGYARGMPPIRFKANFGNSGSATANINGLGAVTLKKNGGASNLASGDIVSGGVYTLIYDGTNFQVLELNAAAVIGLTDGDKGDITVSSNGTVWTIDAGVISMSLGLRSIADITAGDTLIASDRAKIIKIASGTGTLAFTAAATLGAGWYCYIDNNDNSGDVTLDPNSSEQIDGLTSWILYSRGVILVQCDGTAFRSMLLSPMHKVFTANGTLTKPGCGTTVSGRAYGAGASGGRGGSADGGAGGGGGACVPFEFPLSSIGATETVTIGTGGTAISADNTAGNAGTSTTFGSLVTAYGGGAGDGISATPGGGGGGGMLSAGGSVSNTQQGGDGGEPSGEPYGGDGGGGGNEDGGDNTFGGGGGGSGMNSTGNLRGGDSIWGGGGGSGGSTGAQPAGRGGNSVYGGAGGGGGSDSGTPGAGGTSLFGGNGGAGATGAANATAGTAPGGGGGGSETGNSGAGARGELRLVIS